MLSERAATTLTFDRVVAGRKVKKKGKTRCVTAHGRIARKRRCTIYKRSGVLKQNSRAGTVKVIVKGKIGKKKLAVGTYRLTVKATDAAGNKSKRVTARFTVARRARR